ncbi:MAG: molybdopterin biosynthesis protein [Dethiobacteria bacterium]|jgi:putative molybdopterin biosynthesis protein|nr:molybdopterin biosynthesis protein [Bacillota bacterium]
MPKRKIYLQNKPLEEARKLFFQKLQERKATLGSEEVLTVESRGRITSAPVFAQLSSPHYFAAAMDGYAVNAAATFGATETEPKLLKIDIDIFAIDTGQPLPPNTNAVIMVEHVFEVEPGVLEIREPTAPWENVRTIGEDILKTEMILPANHQIRPVDLGALLSGGVKKIKVLRRPRVAILPTGNELVPPGEMPQPGQIIESNTYVFAGQIADWGGEAVRFPIIEDNFTSIKEALCKAAKEYDLVIVSAGSSAGRRDFTAAVIEEVGELYVHGVALRPGKPVILGFIGETPVVGVPGYPVAAFVIMEQFVRPLLLKWQNIPDKGRPVHEARIARRVVSSLKEEEFLRVKAGILNNKLTVTPLARGAGVTMSLVRADGIVCIPQQKEGLEAGEKVMVELLRPLEELEKTITCIGSHDLALDLLNDLLRRRYPEYSLASAHVGSMGGIMALKRGEAHLAGMHLLDEKSGEYNIPYLERLLPGEEIILVNLLYREQGLIVKRGNPKNITKIEDLKRNDLEFINRQKGAGTRLLLDFELKRLNINPAEVNGYEREEYNHLAVAAAVAGGGADVGLGILAAARALDLDFVPLARERYDLAIPLRFWETDSCQKLMEIIKSAAFREKVESLGGYDLSDSGKIIWTAHPNKGKGAGR